VGAPAGAFKACGPEAKGNGRTAAGSGPVGMQSACNRHAVGEAIGRVPGRALGIVFYYQLKSYISFDLFISRTHNPFHLSITTDRLLSRR
jgi:hypothetical protein